VSELASRPGRPGLLASRGARPVLATRSSAHTPRPAAGAAAAAAEVQLDGVALCSPPPVTCWTPGDRVQGAAVFEPPLDEALGTVRHWRPLLERPSRPARPQPPSWLPGRRGAAAPGTWDPCAGAGPTGAGRPVRGQRADRARAVTVAAAALAQRGLLAAAQSVPLAGRAGDGRGAVVAVPALIGTGALDEARALWSRPLARGNAGLRLAVGRLAVDGGTGFRARWRSGWAAAPADVAGRRRRLASLMRVRHYRGLATAACPSWPGPPRYSEPAGAGCCCRTVRPPWGALVPRTTASWTWLVRAGPRGRRRAGRAVMAARHRLLQAWVAMSRGATPTPVRC